MKLTWKQSHTKCKLIYVIRLNGSKIPVNSPLAFTRCFRACLAPGRRVWWYHSVEMGVLTVAGGPAVPALGSWASQALLLPLCSSMPPLLTLLFPEPQGFTPILGFYPLSLCLWEKNPGVLLKFSPGLFFQTSASQWELPWTHFLQFSTSPPLPQSVSIHPLSFFSRALISIKLYILLKCLVYCLSVPLGRNFVSILFGCYLQWLTEHLGFGRSH